MFATTRANKHSASYGPLTLSLSPAATPSVPLPENVEFRASKAPREVGLRLMSTVTGSTTIHKLIEEHGALLLPGLHDALSACAVQKVGFKARYVSGFAVSASHLGIRECVLCKTIWSVKKKKKKRKKKDCWLLPWKLSMWVEYYVTHVESYYHKTFEIVKHVQDLPYYQYKIIYNHFIILYLIIRFNI